MSKDSLVTITQTTVYTTRVTGHSTPEILDEISNAVMHLEAQEPIEHSQLEFVEQSTRMTIP